MYDEHSVKVIKDNIKKSLTDKNLVFSIEITNNNKSIKVYNEDYTNYTFIWIRLLKMVNGLYTVEISNIQLPQNRRREGILNYLYSRLIKCKYVGSIKISSVCTIEMVNWCLKHKLKDDGYFNYSMIL